MVEVIVRNITHPSLKAPSFRGYENIKRSQRAADNLLQDLFTVMQLDNLAQDPLLVSRVDDMLSEVRGLSIKIDHMLSWCHGTAVCSQGGKQDIRGQE